MNKHYTFQEYIENFSSIQDSYDYYFEQQKEIDRLNNIINELQKYIIDRSSISWDDNGAYDDVLDKLKELKENNNAKD